MKAPRRAEVLEIINSRPFVSFKELQEAFPKFSGMTLRRDVDYFEQEGIVIKVRGGAKSMKFITSSAEDTFSERLRTNKGAKDRIAKVAISFLETGRSFYFDSGTTMLRVAEMMPDQRLTVTTSGLNVAAELIKKEQTMVNIVGGLIHRDNITVSGSQAVNFIENINIDVALIVPSGLSATDGFSCGNYIHGELKSLVVEKAKKVIVLIDGSKLGKSLPYTFCGFDKVDVVVSEEKLPDEILEKCKEHGIDVIRA